VARVDTAVSTVDFISDRKVYFIRTVRDVAHSKGTFPVFRRVFNAR
jgi:hypothetical protein